MSKRLKDGLSFQYARNSYCCGITDIGELSIEVGDEYFDENGGCEEELDRRTAIMATTITSQKDVIKRLKQLRFTKVYSFKNSNTGNVVTVWFRAPKRRR